jgi:hypothetical protein
MYFPTKKPKSKMGNTKVTIDGIKFDSKLEARFYWAIKYHQDCKIDVIKGGQGYVTEQKPNPQYTKMRYLDRQNVIELLPKTPAARAIKYIPDFYIQYNKKSYFVDAKGRETDVFKMKMNLYKRLPTSQPKLIIAKTIDEMIQDLINDN